MSRNQTWKRRIRLGTQATHEKKINYTDVNEMSIIYKLKQHKICPDITHNHIMKLYNKLDDYGIKICHDI